jgi:hypothetical protein
MQRQLRTWLLRVAMLAIVVAGISGCGGSDSDTEGPAEPQTTVAPTSVGPTTTVEPTTSAAPTTT